MRAAGTATASKIKLGRWLIELGQHLEPFQSTPDKLALETSTRAARAAVLLARMRRLERVGWGRLAAMAAGVGIGPRDLKQVVLPLLASTGLVEIEDKGDEILAVRETVLSDDEVLLAAAEIWEREGPADVERAVVFGLDLCSRRPQTASEYTTALEQIGIAAVDIKFARQLQSSFRIVREDTFPGLAEPYLYNAYIWGTRAHRVAQYLEHVDPAARDQLAMLLEVVQRGQGMPIERLSANVPRPLILDAQRVGLIDATEVTTAAGERRAFAFTPGLAGPGLLPAGMGGGSNAEGMGNDVFDQVKLFVASIQYGAHYAANVRIADPVRLVEALVRNKEVGPASPIGTDYPLLETAGIVKVRESGVHRGRFHMQLIKSDVAEQALAVLKDGFASAVGPYKPAQASGLFTARGFTGPEHNRVQLAQPTAASQIAQERLLRAMRHEDLL